MNNTSLTEGGNRVFLNLRHWPHLILSGKNQTERSRCTRTILRALAQGPDGNSLKLILMELQDTGFFGCTEELPLFCPVVRGAKSAKEALIRCEEEMNRRLRLIQTSGAGKLEAYRFRSGQQTESLPLLLIAVDELGEWMASEEQTELEDRICALMQTGYGTGIHLLLGTGHPTREVLTARIRASVPSRIALAVDSRQESELILGFPGAETLKGSGVLLYSHPSEANPPVEQRW